jgi:ribosomal protein S18 acetylase RimI-like enzyme
MNIRAFTRGDTEAARGIWNAVVAEADAFPQVNGLSADEACPFFSAQSYTGIAEQDGEVAGVYILHPNNIGRCATIANASYAVKPGLRGRHIGEKLVLDSLAKGRELGFHVLQFNAVVATNVHAIHLYERLGFHRLGCIPGCYETAAGTFTDIFLFWHEL